ncbi:MAG TPA: acyl-CoA carboxylase subunit beta [Thermoanaerobaculia bacterium]|nr:acyl-CoA carboxylase subunit beta [Thermoanaerobaculia bacterium]
MKDPSHPEESPKIRELRARLRAARAGGGPERIERQHRSGKLTARERIDLLLDPGSFTELDALVTHRCLDFGMADQQVPGDGVVTGSGRVHGRPVYVYAQDFTVFGGTVAEMTAAKINKVQDLALAAGAPVVALCDGGGARIQEGATALGAYGEIAWRTVRASGVVPQISCIMGPCAGGPAYISALTDFVFMVDTTGYMFITGPEVIRSVTGEEISQEALGGAAVHACETGTVHFRCRDDAACLTSVRELLAYLPSNNQSEPLPGESADDPLREDPALDELIPMDLNRGYDVKQLVTTVVDDGRFFEVQAEHARNIVVGFARLANRAVGIVANQPLHLAGALDVSASVKASRFVRFCDAFNLPILTFVDTPGYLPGVREEMGGIIRHGAKLLYAYCEATTPMVTVVLRKAYGGAYGVLGSKHVHSDLNFAYPWAEIAVMGAEAGVNVLYRRELERAGEKSEELRTQKLAEFRERFGNPYRAAERGYVDAVILPRQTRAAFARALGSLTQKRVTAAPRRKHTNLPF